MFRGWGGGIFASDRSRLNLDFNNSPSPGDGRTSEPKNSGLEGLRIIARGWRGAAFYILLERSMDCLQRSTRSSRPSLIFILISLYDLYFFILLRKCFRFAETLVESSRRERKQRTFFERGRKGMQVYYP